jgi:hypothetical protein
MSTLSLRLPESLHRQLADVAKREGVSINQLINSAVGEKLAALLTEAYLEERAKRSSRRRFDRALSKVADIEPDDVDRLVPRRPENSELQPTTPRRNVKSERSRSARRDRRS